MKMSSFVPNKQHLREALLFCFNLKKNAAEARCLLEEAYGEHAPSKTTCEDWFKRFRSGDFDTKDKKRSGRPKTIEDADLQALLDEDDTQTQDESLPTTTNQFEPCIARKTARMGHKTQTSDIAARQCSVPSHFHRPRHHQNAEMGSATAPAVFTRRGPFRLSLVPVDGAWLGWATLGQFRRSAKLVG